MNIVEIEVTYAATQSLEGYCNVRPSVRLAARLEEGENPDEVRGALMEEARQAVEAEIDEALIADGKPPRYWDGPRFKVLNEWSYGVVAVVPEEAEWRKSLRWSWSEAYGNGPGLRLDQALEKARRAAEHRGWKWLVLDCSDGDLERLQDEATKWAENVSVEVEKIDSGNMSDYGRIWFDE